jgi:hypothetical protein
MRALGGVGLYCGDVIHVDVGPKRNWNWCGDKLADGTHKVKSRVATRSSHKAEHGHYAAGHSRKTKQGHYAAGHSHKAKHRRYAEQLLQKG